MKKNSSLRAAISNREVSFSALVRMSSLDLANPELKQIREKETQEKLMRLNTANHRTGQKTNMFECARCHHRNCYFYEMQTASGDEPSTKFVECLECSHKWKFR
eukprot:PhF_6_TR21930/c0_g1_i1/m.31160/K03145/TFIIS; transcription elongation factor S-II